MQKFDFRLARVLRMREATASAEQVTLEQARARRAELLAELEALQKSGVEAGRAMKAEPWVRPAELTTLNDYAKRVDREVREWSTRIAAQDEAIRKQEAVLMEAKRNVRLLEKLRDQRRAEWQAGANAETNAITDDFLASQSARERRKAS